MPRTQQQHTPDQQHRPIATPHQGVVPADLLAIYTFADKSNQLLPPTSINDARALEIPRSLPKLTGGYTNLAPAIAMSRKLLSMSNRSLIKKIVVIGDGEASDAALCPVEAGLCREAYISIEAINVGGKDGEATLRSIAAMTVGGRYFEAKTFQALTSALTGSVARNHRRQGITAVLVDVSSSMDWVLPSDPSRTRIQAVVDALTGLVITKRHCFGSAGR
jgi:Mg-chelatase subunit ChlD